MKRRELLLGTIALGATRPLRAQHRTPHRIGWPSAITREAASSFLAAFEQGLRELGYVVGRDVIIDFRTLGPTSENVAAATRELVRAKAEVLVTGTNPVTRAARSAAAGVPIVFVVGINVVAEGFVRSYAAPGGTLTGLTWNVGDSSFNKRIELLKALVPGVSRVAILYEPGLEAGFRGPLEQTAKELRLSLLWVATTSDLKRSFEAAVQGRADALYAIGGAFQFSRRAQLIALANAHRLPATFGAAEFVDAGGLMSYGPNVPDLYRRAASYVDRILKGAKPADLPVEQPMRIDLGINARTARQLGLAIPQSVLLRADRVIE